MTGFVWVLGIIARARLNCIARLWCVIILGLLKENHRIVAQSDRLQVPNLLFSSGLIVLGYLLLLIRFMGGIKIYRALKQRNTSKAICILRKNIPHAEQGNNIASPQRPSGHLLY